jgi:hypothetical protein
MLFPHHAATDAAPPIRLKPLVRIIGSVSAGAARPAASDAWFSSAVLLTAVEPPQPGYLTQCEAVTTPCDRLAHRQALVVGHRPQRFSGAPLSVLDRTVRSPSAVSTATANPSSRRSRSAHFFAALLWASNADRRAACLIDC